MPTRPDPDDCTAGPARAGAAGFLGGAALIGLIWAMTAREPAPVPTPASAPPTAAAFGPVQSPRAPESRPDPAAPSPQPLAATALPFSASVPTEQAPQPSTAEPTSIALLIRINHAPAEELDLLPGVGPVLAQRIIEQRTRGGPFRKPEDLLNVPGIGEKTAAKIVPHLRFD